MSTKTKSALLKENIKLKELLGLITKDDIQTYIFSEITMRNLKSIVAIKQNLDFSQFDSWFNHDIVLNDTDILFLKKLISKNIFNIESYKEENLKIKFIGPILNRVDFSDFEKELCDWYDEPLYYETKHFILKGKVDFVVAKGNLYAEKPYFFIQEFKPSTTAKNPRPQLLAELVAAIELNKFSSIKGAFIIGIIWHFVILEKLDTNKYQYFISKSYDCTDIKKLKYIYKNLIYVKEEIFNLAR